MIRKHSSQSPWLSLSYSQERALCGKCRGSDMERIRLDWLRTVLSVVQVCAMGNMKAKYVMDPQGNILLCEIPLLGLLYNIVGM